MLASRNPKAPLKLKHRWEIWISPLSQSVTYFHSSQCLQDFIEGSGSTRSSFSSRLFRRSKDCCFTWQNPLNRQRKQHTIGDITTSFQTKGQSIPMPLAYWKCHEVIVCSIKCPQSFLFQKKFDSSLCRWACLFSSAMSLPRTANSLTALCSFASSRRALPSKSENCHVCVGKEKRFVKDELRDHDMINMIIYDHVSRSIILFCGFFGAFRVLFVEIMHFIDLCGW